MSVFSDTGVKIYEKRSGILYAKGTLQDGLYYLTELPSTGSAHGVAEEFPTKGSPLPKKQVHATQVTARVPKGTTVVVWHCRLCHAPHRLVQRLARLRIVLGLVLVQEHKDEYPCLACLCGKMRGPVHVPHGPKPLRVGLKVDKDALALAYWDGYGPFRVVGKGGYKYFLLVLLQKSRKLYGFCVADLKNGTVRETLDRLSARLTKETGGLKLRAIHSDNFSSFAANVKYAASMG